MILGNTETKRNLLYFYQEGMADFFFFEKSRKELDMLRRLLWNEVPTEEHREGDFYKVVTVFGRTFELRYGYYDEVDRQNPLCEPVILYPDFLTEPVYTEEGTPFVTVMQDACEAYRGETRRTPDTTCAECKYFKQGEEWFGICTYEKNQSKIKK